MITITFEFETIQEAQMALERIHPTHAAVTPEVVKAAKVVAPKPVKAEAPVAPTPTATETATSTPPAEPVPNEPAAESPSEPLIPDVTYDDVAALVIKYSKLHGRPATVEVLKPFGITSLPGAKPEQFAAIHAAFALELGSV